jgi:uncharacterized membrane protein
MDNFIKLISPNNTFDLSSFGHSLILAIPSSLLIGVIFFFVLGSINSLQSKNYRIWIVISFTFIMSISVAFYNLGVPFETLFVVYTDWLHLIIRWIHIIVGVAWIGTSFYFNWLDSKLIRDDPLHKDIDGYLWSVHSGGFYRIEKLKGPPKKLPDVLHWFKWEAYATWISGFALMIVVFYLNANSMMLNNNGILNNQYQAIFISLVFIFFSWFIYDFLCKNFRSEDKSLFIFTGFLITFLFSYILTQIYGGRAAYIHVGAIIGTIMAANVFRVIIPAQKNLVLSAEKNFNPDLNLSLEAKNRSIHNNYFTLPVLFIMISSHFSFTYGNNFNWLMLAIISIVGALVRHYFNLRNKQQYKVWILPTAAMIMFLLMIVSSLPILKKKNGIISTPNEVISFSEVNNIIKYRCGVCHAKNPTFEGFETAPNGVIYDTAKDIIKNLKKIKEQAIDSNVMPPNNLTGITQTEREKISLWIEQGADINN